MEKYRSLQDIYLNESFAKSLPPLPRQTINWLIEAIADAPPASPDSAYVQLYVKDPSKNEQQFIGNIEVDYFNKHVKPVLSRGSEDAISTNRLVAKRLSDANITNENFNAIFDFIQSTKMQVTPESFVKCQGVFKSAIVSQSTFNIAEILSKSFNTPLENITSHTEALQKLMQLKVKDAASSHANRSKEAGPGEVVIAFFGNGRKLIISKEEEGKGDIALGDLYVEVKAGGGRLFKAANSQGTAHGYYIKNVREAPLNVVKYSALGDNGLKSNEYDDEINKGLAQNIDPRTLATALALRQYQAQHRFAYYTFCDKFTFNCLGFNSAGKDLIEISNFYKTNIGKNHLGFDFVDGHQLPGKYNFS
jgi:hypothetical protein